MKERKKGTSKKLRSRVQGTGSKNDKDGGSKESNGRTENTVQHIQRLNT